MNKKRISIFGLFAITFAASIQYAFLQIVPDSVSTFTFLFITNLIGFLIIAVIRFKSLFHIKKTALLKGMLLAAELTVMNVFLLLGARDTDSVITASVYSMYFIFVTPILILLRKKFNFFSANATVVAIIALLLLFDVDVQQIIANPNILFILVADVFFALYVVGVSFSGEKEDAIQLTLSQMLFCALFSFVGWMVEIGMGITTFSVPTETNFWISALFIAVFIRAIYGVGQIVCQKYVSPVTASLIFSSEIIFTLLMEPFMSRAFGTEYTPVTVTQLIGIGLFIIASLMLNQDIMKKFGYSNLSAETVTGPDGKVRTFRSISGRVTLIVTAFSVTALVVSTIVSFSGMYYIKDSAVSNSEALGNSAAAYSSGAIETELQTELVTQADNKAKIADTTLTGYGDDVLLAAAYANSLYASPSEYSSEEVDVPQKVNDGKLSMQRILQNTDIQYADVKDECCLLGNLVDVFEPLLLNNSNVVTIYIGTESGLLISYDANAGLADCGVENYYDYKESEWYTLGQTAETYVFTDPYADSYGRGLTITCLAPVRDADGTFLACIAMDILVEDLNTSLVNDGVKSPDAALLVNRRGEVIAANGMDTDSEETLSIRNAAQYRELSKAADLILTGTEGIVSTGAGDNSLFIAYSTVENTNWKLCLTCPVSEITEAGTTIKDKIGENTTQVVSSLETGVKSVIQAVLLICAIVLILITISVGKFTRMIVQPIRQLESDVKEISLGNLNKRTHVSTRDEIGSLANSFNAMTDSLQEHIEELKEATAKEQRIASELNLATEIQVSSLPSNFHDGEDYALFAKMDPALEVGGDFYDFFEIDEDHLGLVMADVSGKGVPAALFMMNSKTLINSQCRDDLSPASVLTKVNGIICGNNVVDMFVTVWLGIVDLKTGVVKAANAGHEYPIIGHSGGDFELFKDKHGFVVGGMEGIKYKEYEFTLNKGDRLFLYTDGATEATNAGSELFGTDRLLMSLNNNKDADTEEILKRVRADIDGFVKDAPQFDDITMMCFEYR